MAKQIEIKLIKSIIGSKPNQRATAMALGLKKIDRTVKKEATPTIMGMVSCISHLVEVTEL
ncbi:MAG: 50S ribosomal protein L30 [Spirochaetales bacterium]|nr:50S ribosomal protein L30 [Spirochaetales bacterium]